MVNCHTHWYTCVGKVATGSLGGQMVRMPAPVTVYRYVFEFCPIDCSPLLFLLLRYPYMARLAEAHHFVVNSSTTDESNLCSECVVAHWT